ncbi:MAG: glycosyltransferase family 4 protein [Mucilaginibacter sp.]|nr:glycosyltransferase family 4 protein [Mucilaginibacter sp.]
MNHPDKINKRRIAIFGVKTYPAFAGADRVAENVFNNIYGEFDVFIYLSKKKNQERFSDDKRFVYLPALNGKHLHAFSFFFLCMLHMLFVADYDLIHAHNSDVGLFTHFLRFKYKNRIMGTFHGDPYKSGKWGRFAKWYLKFSETLFIKSCTILTSVSATKIIQGKKIEFIPNGMERVDRNMYKNYTNISINYHELKIDKGNYILFVAGRLDSRKGLHYLLDAYNNRLIDQQLVIISDFRHDKNYTQLIEQKIKALNETNIIVLKQLIPKNDLFDVVKNAKLVVFPSEIEAMSMFLLEVLACQAPVVCSDIDSNVQIVGADYKYLFKNTNVFSLSAAIQLAMRDIDANKYNEHISLSEGIKSKYDWNKIVTEYSNLYKSLFKELDNNEN